MLDKEMWKRLPVAMPSLAEALLHRSGSEDAVGSSADFEQHVTRGNPWRRQQGEGEPGGACVPGAGAC